MLPADDVVRIHVHIVRGRCPSFVEGSGKENIVPVRLMSRETRLYQRRFRDRERAYFYTLPSDAKYSKPKNSRLFAGIRCALRYLTEAVYTSFQSS